MRLTKCPMCGNKTDTIIAFVRNGVYSSGCRNCLMNQPKAEFSAKWKRDRQAETYRKDLIQPYNGDKPNPEFLKAYPDKADRWFSKEQQEKMWRM